MANSLILAKAQNAVTAHDWTTAARLYKELLRNDESNMELIQQLGSIYVRAGQDEKAIKPIANLSVSLPSGNITAAAQTNLAVLSARRTPSSLLSISAFLSSSLSRPSHLAEYTPGCPSRASTIRPLSSASTAHPASSWRARAFMAAFSSRFGRFPLGIFR